MPISKHDECLIVNHVFFDSPKFATLYFSYEPETPFSMQKLRSYISKCPLKPESFPKLIERLDAVDLDSIKSTLERYSIQTLSYADEHYPTQLKELTFAPVILYSQGNRELLKKHIFGIVGSRTPTPYGEKLTEKFSKALSRHLCIISGLAKGIDAIAHKHALNSSGGTIAVLGSGLNHIYPASHRSLFNQIKENGLVISEFPPHIKSFPYHFPQRNRIISGLSSGLLIPEAKIKSGSLITAHLALDQNKDIFAIPGSVHSELSTGPIQLIKEGAYVASHPEDIFRAYDIEIKTDLPLFSSTENTPDYSLTQQEAAFFKDIPNDPITIDELCLKTQRPIHEVLQFVTLLEMKGAITQLNQHTIQRR